MSQLRLIALFLPAFSLLGSAGCSQQVDAGVSSVQSAVTANLSSERRASFVDVGAIAISTGEAFFKSVGGIAVTVDVSDFAEGGVSDGYKPSPLKPGRVDLGGLGLANIPDLLAWRRAVAQHKASRKDVTVVLYGVDGIPAVQLQLHGALPSAHDARSAVGASHGGTDDSIAFEFEGDEWQPLSFDTGVRLRLSNTLDGRLAVSGVPGAWVTSVENVAAPIDLSHFFSVENPNGTPGTSEPASFRAVLDVNGAAAAFFGGWGAEPRDLFFVPPCTQTSDYGCPVVRLRQSQLATSELPSTEGRHVVELTHAGLDVLAP
ncbi:MAG: phage tail protein [Polyangiales bacterium]